MQTILQAAFMGIVQGLTEFLPVSSSAHLILVPRLLGWTDAFLNSAAFDVMLHVGTLLALLAYFRVDLVRLLRAGIASLAARTLGDDPERRLAWLLVVSVIPAALLGATLESFFDTYFRERPAVVAVLLLAGAAILWLAERQGRRERGLMAMRLRDAIVIGAAQALALFPGTSRSGITIAAGLFLGLERAAAARFAFLMGVPVIAGAGLWKARELLGAQAVAYEPAVLLSGMLAAAVSGTLAITVLLRFLREHSTGVFVAYRVAFAALVFVALLAT
jgi:undecaprenyl-diphosphatase